MYMYLYRYVLICKYLLPGTHIIMCHGFIFWGCDLSPEHAVAHPLHLSLFPPRYMHGSVCVHIEGYGAEYSVLT